MYKNRLKLSRYDTSKRTNVTNQYLALTIIIAFQISKSYQFCSISSQNKSPKDCREKEEKGQGEEDCWKRDFSGRQEALAVLLDDEDGEVGGRHQVPIVRVVAVVVEQGI